MSGGGGAPKYATEVVTYAGDWRNGLEHGEGDRTLWPSGDREGGAYRNGMREGRHVIVATDGTHYLNEVAWDQVQNSPSLPAQLRTLCAPPPHFNPSGLPRSLVVRAARGLSVLISRP